MKELQQLELNIGYTFKNKELLLSAITHKSYAFEKKTQSINEYNERLEFLGDSILEHIISYELYKVKPELNEGNMSKKRALIVCESSLSEVMRKLNVSEFMKIGKCEEVTGGRNKDAILADMFEAVLGAIYLDSDFFTAREVCLKLLKETFRKAVIGTSENQDYKTLLQEKLQINGNISIEYKVIKEEGPDHDKQYYINVYAGGNLLGSGSGKSKKIAEQQAAKNALEVKI